MYLTMGKRIRAARVKAGYTQQYVADQLNPALSNVGYGAYERGEREIGLDYLLQLSRILSKPLNYFLGIPDEYTPDEQDLIHLYRKADEKHQKAAKLWLTL